MLLLLELPSLNEVMNCIEGEETRRVVMDPQSSEDSKAKALAASRSNPKLVIQGTNQPAVTSTRRKDTVRKIAGVST
jgi:hypothetical protein